MPKLTFAEAQVTESGQEGIDVLFTYTVDDSSERQAIHVLGSPNSWGVNDRQKVDYVKLLFTGTVAYLKDHWETYQELPADKKQLASESDFPPYQKLPTDWEGYILHLI